MRLSPIVEEWDDIMSVEDYKESIDCSAFTDDDGYAQLVYGESVDRDSRWLPSQFHEMMKLLPTQINWINK